jgi:hypothetical protein
MPNSKKLTRRLVQPLPSDVFEMFSPHATLNHVFHFHPAGNGARSYR